MMKVLFVIAEAYPFAKTGGLGDVGGSLPIVLNKSPTAKVRVMMPKYGCIPEEYLKQMRVVTSFKVDLAWRRIECSIEELEYFGTYFYFLNNEYYFGQEKLYGSENDGERFAFFCKAALESLPYLHFRPDIIHCNDWHTALIPLMLQEDFGHNPYYYGMKTVFSIHNLKYQGIFPKVVFDDVLGYGGHKLAWEKLEFYGEINYLQAGLLAADLLTTVSPTYAQEIQNAYFGENLDGILRQRKEKLRGILNGIDTKKYDPLIDPHLAVNYRSSLCQKEKNKEALQEILNLPVRGDLPLLALVSRLVDQKGLNLVTHILEEMLSMELQVVILGTGDQKYEEFFSHLAHKYPFKIAVRIMFDEVLAHQIYAGADMLLMPSQYEPCGLAQMIAMRYGTIPIVRETGGLKDTVLPYNKYTGEGNGFSFANYNAHELLFTVQRAVKLFFEDKNAWKGLAENARKSDFSWEKSAKQYLELYHSLS
jgi:starch synthase